MCQNCEKSVAFYGGRFFTLLSRFPPAGALTSPAPPCVGLPPTHSAHTEQRRQAFISRASGAHHHYPGRRQATHTPVKPVGGDIAQPGGFCKREARGVDLRPRPSRRAKQGALRQSEITAPPSAASAARRAPAKRDHRPRTPLRWAASSPLCAHRITPSGDFLQKISKTP